MGLMGSLRQNRDILEHQIKKGTAAAGCSPTRRKYATDCCRHLPRRRRSCKRRRGQLGHAAVVLRAIIDIAIPREASAGLVIGARVAFGAGLALFDAFLSLFERRTSAVIGEGLIYDLRTKVFTHIQEMPIAFFSRTQTGALISRLNNDVIGAQQAFTDLFSNVVGNVILVVIVIGTMLVLSWQITLVALLLLPVFLIPARRRVGRKLGTLFQRGMELNAEMNMVMTERFNVSGAMLVKRSSVARATTSAEFFDEPNGRSGARHRHQSGHVPTLLLHCALPDGFAGDRQQFAYGIGGIEVIHGALMPPQNPRGL